MTDTPQSWPLRFRVVAVSAFLAAIITSAVVVIPSDSADRPSPTRALRIALRSTHPFISRPQIIVPAASPATVPGPSEFDKERQMGFGHLMKRWNPFISEASKRFGVPEGWIRIVMQIESGGRTMLGENRPIVSSAGAMGLMQLMPSTYDDMRRVYALGPDPYSPRDNIFAGAAYLRWLYAKYGYPEMFAAYNDGPGNLEERLVGAGLLPAETRSYLDRVTAALGGARSSRAGLAKFTRPNGLPVLIDSAAVISIRAALPGEYAPGVQSVIEIGRLRQGVCENLATAKAILRAHGGTV